MARGRKHQMGRRLVDRTILALVLAIVPGASPAEVFTQTDWSAGSGVGGPVSQWGNAFDVATGISAERAPGELSLLSQPLAAAVKHRISHDFVKAFGIFGTDMDGDGDTDVLGGAEGSQAVILWLNDGANPPVWTERVIDPAFISTEAVWGGDLDGDGRKDVVATSKGSSSVLAWWHNDGGNPPTWTKYVIRQPWGNTYEVCVGDMDLDGDLDILSTSCTSYEVAWWRNDGGTPLAWTFQVIGSGFGEAHSAWFADLDGDGDSDVVAAGSTANEIAWWRNEGGSPPSWTKTMIRSGFSGARSVRTGDIDRDGRIDVVGTCWGGQVAWWRNDGGDPVAWTEHTVDATLSGGHSVGLEDLDGDGDLDVIAAGFTSQLVRWYENQGGNPVAWTARTVATAYSGAAEVATADVDGDGDPDILGTSYYGNDFNWWEVVEYRASGELTSSILDTQGSFPVASLSWTGRLRAGTSLSFKVRGSGDPDDLGSWSGDITTPGVLDRAPGRYVQYCISLQTTDPRHSPVVEEVRIHGLAGPAAIDGDMGERDPGVDESGRDQAAPRILVATPARAPVTIELAAPGSDDARFSVYDVAGRLVSTHVRQRAAGPDRLVLKDLAPGVYLCRLTAGDRSAERRLIVIP
jgi:hypothetical protein